MKAQNLIKDLLSKIQILTNENNKLKKDIK